MKQVQRIGFNKRMFVLQKVDNNRFEFKYGTQASQSLKKEIFGCFDLHSRICTNVNFQKDSPKVIGSYQKIMGSESRSTIEGNRLILNG